MRCSSETRRLLSVAQKGKPRTLSHRDGCHCARCDVGTRARIAASQPGPKASPKSGTRIEQILVGFLRAAGYAVEEQRRFGRCVVDAYLPERHVAFEADGEYWHGRPERVAADERRDGYLLREHGLPVVRMTGIEVGGLTT